MQKKLPLYFQKKKKKLHVLPMSLHTFVVSPCHRKDVVRDSGVAVRTKKTLSDRGNKKWNANINGARVRAELLYSVFSSWTTADLRLQGCNQRFHVAAERDHASPDTHRVHQHLDALMTVKTTRRRAATTGWVVGSTGCSKSTLIYIYIYIYI
jgi:hypothetical protein